MYLIDTKRGKSIKVLTSAFLACAILLILEDNQTYAQQKELEVSAGTKVLAATEGELPFWHFSNVLGTVDASSTNSLSFLKANTRFYETENFFMAGDITAIGRFSDDNIVQFPIYKFSANWHGFQFDAGRFARPVGLNNHDLSTGSMIESNNAIPLNRVMVSNPAYKNVPFTDGLVEYRGMISHGWFSDERFTKDVFLHQKDLFAKVNLENFTLHGGLSHNVMWGGENSADGQLPSGFGDFIDVFFGNSASRDDNVPQGEITNRLGNTLFYFAFALEYHHDRFDLNITRSFLKEDTGSKATRSPWDGIFGVEFAFKDKPLLGYIDNIQYEYINTIRQQAKDIEARGRANFYNNFVYESGWTSQGKVIGSSLAVFDPSRSRGGRVTNNMFIGHHVGFNGSVTQKLDFETLVTYSRNYGTMRDRRNDVPFDGVSDPQDKKFFFDRSGFRKDQYSVLIGADYALNNAEDWVINASVSWDIGELYSNNVGFNLGVTWNNIFNY